jgi:hypothetical protein
MPSSDLDIFCSIDCMTGRCIVEGNHSAVIQIMLLVTDTGPRPPSWAAAAAGLVPQH